MSSATIALRRSTSFAAMRARAFFRIILRSEEHTSELQSQSNLVCRLLLEKKKGVPSSPLLEADRGLRIADALAPAHRPLHPEKVPLRVNDTHGAIGHRLVAPLPLSEQLPS